MSDQNSVLVGKVSKKKQPQYVNFEDLLKQIQKKIGQIKKQDSTKDPLDLLYVSALSCNLFRNLNIPQLNSLRNLLSWKKTLPPRCLSNNKRKNSKAYI